VVDDVGTDRRRLLELLFAEHRVEMIELAGGFGLANALTRRARGAALTRISVRDVAS
jgi:hypothetical protein